MVVAMEKKNKMSWLIALLSVALFVLVIMAIVCACTYDCEPTTSTVVRANLHPTIMFGSLEQRAALDVVGDDKATSAGRVFEGTDVGDGRSVFSQGDGQVILTGSPTDSETGAYVTQHVGLRNYTTLLSPVNSDVRMCALDEDGVVCIDGESTGFRAEALTRCSPHACVAYSTIQDTDDILLVVAGDDGMHNTIQFAVPGVGLGVAGRPVYSDNRLAVPMTTGSGTVFALLVSRGRELRLERTIEAGGKCAAPCVAFKDSNVCWIEDDVVRYLSGAESGSVVLSGNKIALMEWVPGLKEFLYVDEKGGFSLGKDVVFTGEDVVNGDSREPIRTYFDGAQIETNEGSGECVDDRTCAYYDEKTATLCMLLAQGHITRLVTYQTTTGTLSSTVVTRSDQNSYEIEVDMVLSSKGLHLTIGSEDVALHRLMPKQIVTGTVVCPRAMG